MFDDTYLAEQLWKRWEPKQFLTQVDEWGDTWRATGLNCRFRLARYGPGDKFEEHEDGFYWSAWNKRTFATFMMYLNDVPIENGGATEFHEHGVSIQPKEGSLVVFPVDNLLHRGQVLMHGEKYILRTDIMYELESCRDETTRKSLYELYTHACTVDDDKSWSQFLRVGEEYKL